MKKLSITTALTASLLLASYSQAAILAADVDSTSLQALSGATDSFQQTYTDAATGAIVTVEYTFTATGAGSPTIGTGARMGVDSDDNVSTSGDSAVNPGETLAFDVSFISVTGLAPGDALGTLDFNIDQIDLFRGSPNGGSGISFTWDSSATTVPLVSPLLTGAGGQPTDIVDDSTFDLLTGDYSGIMTVSGTVDSTPGVRWGTNSGDFTVDFNLTVVSEPTTSLLILAAAPLALLRRRRK